MNEDVAIPTWAKSIAVDPDGTVWASSGPMEWHKYVGWYPQSAAQHTKVVGHIKEVLHSQAKEMYFTLGEEVKDE